MLCFRVQSSSLSFTEHAVNDFSSFNTWKEKNGGKNKNTTKINGGREEYQKKYLSSDTWYLRWHVTTWQVGVVASVANITAHNVVAVVTFWDLILRIYTDLWRTGKKKITQQQQIKNNNNPSVDSNQFRIAMWPGETSGGLIWYFEQTLRT